MTKLSDLLAQSPEVPEAPDAIALPPIEGDIQLHDVTFGYDPDEPVLRDLRLRIGQIEPLSVAYLVLRMRSAGFSGAGDTCERGHEDCATSGRLLRATSGKHILDMNCPPKDIA